MSHRLAPTLTASAILAAGVATVAVFAVPSPPKQVDATPATLATRPPASAVPGTTAVEPPQPQIEVVTLTTADGDDVEVSASQGSITVQAKPTNTTKAQRHLVVPDGRSLDGDGQWCAEVSGSTETTAQPGLALIDGDRAITLTNNIWGRDRAQWNIHGWHRDAAGSWAEPAQLHGVRLDGFEEAVRPDMPWTMCVSAVGSTVSFSARPAGQPDPDGSPDATRWMAGPLEVPAEFAVDQSRSRGGYFAGHLQAGETLTFAA